MLWLTQIFGRFHPLLVHLPIGILIIGFLFECLAFWNTYRMLRRAVQPTLFLGALSAIISAVSGFFLSREGGYDDRLLMLHQNFGIATAAFATLLFFVRKSVVTYFPDKKRRRIVRIFMYAPLMGLLSITGHLGGSMTHGEDYLFAPPAQDEKTATPSVKITSIAAADSAVLYADVIEPILEAKCYSCHSSAKQKGQLRLDSEEHIRKGGKHGEVLVRGVADSSSLYGRLMLPLEDEKHMPPNEKPQLSSSEIALVQAWVEDGASFNKRIGSFQQHDRIKGYLAALLTHPDKDESIPECDVSAADDNAVRALTSRGVLILPVGEESHYLSVSFVNARNTGDADLQTLLPLKQQIVWLNLSRSKITDEGLKTVAQLSGIRQLQLEYTAVGDAGLNHLTSLEQLRLLNVVGTKVTDAGVASLSPLTNLKKLFLYQTTVTAEGIRKFQSSTPAVIVDTGSYQLPVLATDSVVYKRKT
ncbi:c-type cytochrome domain-containing protein [Chryseolinea lacunae]|uniref:Cytochrome C Planctomycete-type domain-containing protein n=1 Tax=Chryseolinea lacunae TaxID=2801331 RepID=A0ABS1KWC6_9BACT|nr:c-type cytochrome domain-containing protein [Chryseolinea lacunae]MBL0743532.1 hypothetical protein [Chryseolinea lacunae]